MTNTVTFLKSKIVWVQIVAILALLFEQYGQLGFMNSQVALFVSFSLTAVLQKFASHTAIVQTGISKDNTLFWTNVVAAAIMISDYFLQNQIFQAFGLNASMAGMLMVTVNLVLRTYFTNQAAEEVKE
jgi:hypothetical protein